MAIVSVPPFYLIPPYSGSNPTTAANLALTASGTQAATICAAPKTGAIRRIGLRIGTAATPTDTDVRMETVSARFPTGTLFGANTNGTLASGSITANAMNMVTLTADANVTAGDLFAIVFVPSGSPSFNATTLSGIPGGQFPYPAVYNGSAWTASGASCIAAVEYSDGTYATMPMVFPIDALNTHTFNSGSTPDEIGARFQLPVSMRVSGYWFAVDLDNDLDVVLYDSDGVTPLLTSAVTTAARQATSATTPYVRRFATTATLTAATYYYFAIKPGASNISIYSWDVPSAAAMDQMPGGQDWHYVSAKDPSGTGSWTAITTRYPVMGLLIDGIEQGAAAAASTPFFIVND